MNITETPIAKNNIAIDLFEINELYSRTPVNLADPIESDKIPKKNDMSNFRMCFHFITTPDI